MFNFPVWAYCHWNWFSIHELLSLNINVHYFIHPLSLFFVIWNCRKKDSQMKYSYSVPTSKSSTFQILFFYILFSYESFLMLQWFYDYDFCVGCQSFKEKSFPGSQSYPLVRNVHDALPNPPLNGENSHFYQLKEAAGAALFFFFFCKCRQLLPLKFICPVKCSALHLSRSNSF